MKPADETATPDADRALDEAPTPPTATDFERFASMMARDLRSIQIEEYGKATKSHFSGSSLKEDVAYHNKEGADILEALDQSHTNQRIMFHSCIAKLRSFYAKAREQQASQDRSRPQFGGAEKSSDFERGM